MASFKKTTTLKGDFKNIVSNGTQILDADTGEEIDVIAILHSVYGNNVFTLKSDYKSDEEV